MKKVILYSLAIALTGLAVSCNNKSDVVSIVPPSAQANAIDSFINANGLATVLTQDTAAGTTGLMSYIISPGNLNRKFNDSIPVIYFKISGTFLNGTPFYTTSNGDMWINLSTNTASSQDAITLFSSVVVYYYLTSRLGEGGSVICVSPSQYTYANGVATFSTGVTIPANTPLFYSNISIDSIRSH